VRILAMVAATVAMVACSPGGSPGRLPPSAPTVQVEIDDTDVRHPKPVPAGRVVFRIRNRGQEPHQLTLLQLSEDSPPIEQRLDQEGGPAPAYVAQVPGTAPGGTGMFAAELKEGRRYALVDLSRASDGTLRGRRGVASEFQPHGDASATPSSGPQPTPGGS
jgi:hypothetical protein